MPAEAVFERELSSFDYIPPVLYALQDKAKSLGLWNIFLAEDLPNTDYARLCCLIGRSFLAPHATNTAAPDSGNMEVLSDHGSAAQKRRYLRRLADGQIRSAFLMTEREVASSDARNIRTEFVRGVRGGKEGYVVTGLKWWSTGAADPRCDFFLVLGRVKEEGGGEGGRGKGKGKGDDGDGGGLALAAPTLLLVPKRSKGVKVLRNLTVFGYDDAPFGHSEVSLDGVWVDKEDGLIKGEGEGFRVAQGRLGRGRLHHCMRAVGLGERAFEAMLARSQARVAFGKKLAAHGMTMKKVADARKNLECARYLTLKCAEEIDRLGAKNSRGSISLAKYAVPSLISSIIDDAIQVHGGMGLCEDTFLSRGYAMVRSLRVADGPDEVHAAVIAKEEQTKEVRRRLRRRGVAKL